MLQCSCAVEYLHGLTPPLVHRDIKPGNVLLKSKNGELWVKLTDLGLAKIYENHPNPKTKKDISEKCMVGSCYFMAPEIFEEIDAWIYKEPVDVFALGLLFLILHRNDRERVGNRQILPISVEHLDEDITAENINFFGDQLITSVQENTVHPKLFADDDTGPLQELILKMTDYYPKKRPKVPEIVKELEYIIESAIRPESGLHPGGARPRIYPQGREAASSETILPGESHVVTPKVIDNTKLKKKNEAMDSLLIDEENQIRMVTPRNTRGTHDRRQNCKNILLIGETGSGKTTLVSGIYNYIRQVNWDEPNRYCITEFTEQQEAGRDSTESQTDWITVYAIPNITVRGEEFTINVVDTPGLADTRGVEYDESLKERLQKFFQNSKGHGLLTIDAVCYVWSASENKLTAARQKIIESVLSLFARDIGKNIVGLVCFADEFEPQVYQLLGKLHIPQQNKFKFNNGVLFKARGLENTWKWTMESYRQFFDYLINIEPVSTTLTVQMLQQKILLELVMSDIKRKVQKHCELVQEHQSIVQQINQKPGEDNTVMNIKAIFHYQDAVVNDPKKESLQCKKCDKTTCHYPCKQWDVTVFKYFCERIDRSGNCKNCGHNVTEHFKDSNIHYEERKLRVDKSVAELIEQYIKDENIEKTKARLITTLGELQKINRIKLTNELNQIHLLNKTLHKIALYMPTKETIGEIIDDFIEEEEKEKKQGYEERVMIYEECKKQIAADKEKEWKKSDAAYKETAL